MYFNCDAHNSNHKKHLLICLICLMFDLVLVLCFTNVHTYFCASVVQVVRGKPAFFAERLYKAMKGVSCVHIYIYIYIYIYIHIYIYISYTFYEFIRIIRKVFFYVRSFLFEY